MRQKELDHIIKGCKKGKERSQYELVQRYSGMLFTVCRRYSTDSEIAKDILQESWIQIFTKIDSYKFTGSFEAWMRKVAVRCALKWIKKNSNQVFNKIQDIETISNSQEPPVLDHLNAEQIIQLIQELPIGYRTIFNMYTIEGYNHKEIAELLNIKESSSRSQLTRAKVILRKKIQSIDIINYKTA